MANRSLRSQVQVDSRGGDEETLDASAAPGTAVGPGGGQYRGGSPRPDLEADMDRWAPSDSTPVVEVVAPLGAGSPASDRGIGWRRQLVTSNTTTGRWSGGGAFCIASAGTIVLPSSKGRSWPMVGLLSPSALESGGGSGGAIRLVANLVSGSRWLAARRSKGGGLAGDGGTGRIRVKDAPRSSSMTAETRPSRSTSGIPSPRPSPTRTPHRCR